MIERDAAYHYPHDVYKCIVDAVPLITRGKEDVLTFFRGCGVDQGLIAKLKPWAVSGSDKSKYHITKCILTEINELGDSLIRVRREVVKRIAEFENFAACFPDNQLKAQGAVAKLSQLVNQKDAFTRLQNIREDEQREVRKGRERTLAQQKALSVEREQIRNDLGQLFSVKDAQRRGKALEDVLNRLFRSDGIIIRKPLRLRHKVKE